MKDIRGIVRNLLNDDTVREKKPVDMSKLATERTASAPTTAPKSVGSGRTVQASHGPTLRPPLVRTTPPAPPVSVEATTLDADCAHQWQWKNGVKTCWLCGGPAPADRRDASTRWRG